MQKPNGDNEMSRITQTLPTTMMARRHTPRGWIIAGLALVAWIGLLAAGYGLWLLVT